MPFAFLYARTRPAVSEPPGGSLYLTPHPLRRQPAHIAPSAPRTQHALHSARAPRRRRPRRALHGVAPTPSATAHGRRRARARARTLLPFAASLLRPAPSGPPRACARAIPPPRSPAAPFFAGRAPPPAWDPSATPLPPHKRIRLGARARAARGLPRPPPPAPRPAARGPRLERTIPCLPARGPRRAPLRRGPPPSEGPPLQPPPPDHPTAPRTVHGAYSGEPCLPVRTTAPAHALPRAP
jgi:hypothetical protein